MAVTDRDVRHVAQLARIGVSAERIPALVVELNGILRHMDVLERIDTSAVEATEGIGAAGLPLRSDGGTPYPLAHDRERFAPEMRDGFLLVPRLSTHEETGGGDSPG